MAETMKAIRIHQYGGPEVMVLEDVSRPEPGPGEVLVRVHAAGVNPIDYKVRDGAVPLWRDLGLPATMGFDVSGEVATLGDGVGSFKPGDDVYGMVGFPKIGGTYAEYVTVPAGDIALKPNSVDHLQAASMPLAALTAWQCLFDLGGLEAGQGVLIHAAAGGVGHLAVQLARWKGATSWGTASGRNRDFLAGLGLDHFIDYTASRFEDECGKVDVIFDTMGGEIRERSWALLKPGGILVTISGRVAPGSTGPNGERLTGHSVLRNGAELAEIARLVDEGKVEPVIDSVFPLADAAKANDHVATHHVRGKVVLQVAD